jgi:two-component system sensor histidine kinase/response regulator
MTANAMVGDREKVLAAGMNDHIAKPINVAQMYAVLARWVRREKGPAAAPVTPASRTVPASPPAGQQPLNGLNSLPGIDSRTALAALRNDERIYRRLLGRFLASQADFPVRFEAARRSEDPGAAQRVAHDLKGLAGTAGAMALAQAAARLEAACGHGAGAADIALQLEIVEGLLEPVVAGLRALEAAAGAAPSPV